MHKTVRYKKVTIYININKDFLLVNGLLKSRISQSGSNVRFESILSIINQKRDQKKADLDVQEDMYISFKFKAYK